MKECTKCKQHKPFEAYGKDKHSKDGFTCQCRDCRTSAERAKRSDQTPEEVEARRARYRAFDLKRKEQRKVYRDSRRSERREYNKKWAKENPEIIRAGSKRWIENNRDWVNARMRAYKKKHPEYFKEKTKSWERRNPDKLRAIRVSGMERRRARINAAEGSFSPSDIKAMLIEQNCRCYACEKDITTTYSIDHIHPLSRGGSNYLSNIQLLCQSCNSSKGGKDPRQWSLETGKRVKGIIVGNGPDREAEHIGSTQA